MTALLENPWLIGLIGVLLAGMCVGGWTQTGRKEPLLAAAGVLLLTIVAIVVERMVETDQESVVRTLNEMASALEKNDHPKVLSYVYEKAPDIRQRAERELSMHEFRSVRVTRVDNVQLDMQHLPPKAVVEFNAVADGSFAGGVVDSRIARFIEFTMYKIDDEWRIREYAHYDPSRVLRDRDGGPDSGYQIPYDQY